MDLILSANSDNTYSLTGRIDTLFSNKRAKLLLKSKLKVEVHDDSLQFYSEESIDTVVNIIKLAASYVGLPLSYDTGTSKEIKEYSEKEEQFARFAKAAEEIKANNCNKEEFAYFADILDKNMLARHLYPLQLLSAYHLAFSQNGCNFSVPGAGKTSIVYGAYTYLKYQTKDIVKRVDKLLIIGPLSSFGPWESEYEECFDREVDSQRMLATMSLEKKKQYFFENPSELTLMSYPSVVSLKDEIKSFLKRNKVMVVLDEAHKIKNTTGGIIANSIMDIAQGCSSRVILTGTPAPNGYEDLYNLFHFIWPQHDIIKYTIGQLREMSKATLPDSRVAKMMDNINPFYIRIKKSDLGLPPAKDNDPIIVPMDDAQRRIYDFIEQRFVEEATSNSVDSGIHSVLLQAKTIRLQQAATNPFLLYDSLSSFVEEGYDNYSAVDDSSIMKEIMAFYDGSIPAKFRKCLELAKEIICKGEKVIIWTIFIKNVLTLESYFKKNGIDCRTLYGATPVADDTMEEEEFSKSREGIVKEFHNPNSPYKVIIANPFAVAESISLHKACHNAIYLERSFNCAHFLQSKDRIHRYGLPLNTETNYYYLLSEDSIDETIHSRLKIKESRMLNIIERMPIPLFTNITDEGDEDIKAIITDYVKRAARKEI